MNRFNVDSLNSLKKRASEERDYSEKNYYITLNNNIKSRTISLSKTMEAINNMAVEVQSIYNEYKKNKRENAMLKTDLNRVNMELQKQNMLNKKLIIKKSTFKTKEEYDNELKNNLDIKRRMTSTINTQFEEIQRILAEKEDKFEFINRQMKKTYENCVYQKTTLLLKRIEKEKEDDYYKSLCKTVLINGILSSNIHFKVHENLMGEQKNLKKHFHVSVKNLKTVLKKVDACKSDLLLRFDGSYEGIDKIQILKLITSNFNLIITIGYMQIWKYKAEITKRNAELCTVQRTYGKPVDFRSPFNRRTVISFPTDDLSFKDSYVFLNAARAKENTTENNKTDDEGFESLQLSYLD